MTTAKEWFDDNGLMLAVLNGLMLNGVLSESDCRARLARIANQNYGLGPDDEPIEIERKRAKEGLARLGEMELNKTALQTIESLDFDGGNEIYMTFEDAIDIDTGGEEDWYCLKALTNIGLLTALRSLDLDGYGYRETSLDLTPLAAHPALTELVLSGRCISADTLDSLPALKTLSVGLAKIDTPAVLKQLTERGIKVRD